MIMIHYATRWYEIFIWQTKATKHGQGRQVQLRNSGTLKSPCTQFSAHRSTCSASNTTSLLRMHKRRSSEKFCISGEGPKVVHFWPNLLVFEMHLSRFPWWSLNDQKWKHIVPSNAMEPGQTSGIFVSVTWCIKNIADFLCCYVLFQSMSCLALVPKFNEWNETWNLQKQKVARNSSWPPYLQMPGERFEMF